jgi:hypothetical protein
MEMPAGSKLVDNCPGMGTPTIWAHITTLPGYRVPGVFHRALREKALPSSLGKLDGKAIHALCYIGYLS